MRIICLLEDSTINAWYRLVAPLRMLTTMGHDVRSVTLEQPGRWESLLRWGDLLCIHRSCNRSTIELARRARRAGIPVVWDDDDDVTSVPKGSTAYREMRGRKGQQRLRDRTRLFQFVDLVTTPSDTLGRNFLRGGARDVCVIENYIIDEYFGTERPRDGTWIGWVACEEHRFDLEHIPVADALQRLLDANPDVGVMTIGVRLPISHLRYEHVPVLRPRDLLPRLSTLDIGIAPLSTKVALNHSRSNVKLKEYAAVGVPWLASPIGPYTGLGEDEGGRLVADDRWYEELDALVSDSRRRRQLAKQAARWGREQLLSQNIDYWEAEFEDLVERRDRLAS